MNHEPMRSARLVLAAAVLFSLMPAAHAEAMACTMKYTLSGWSVFYKTASGRGTVSCSDGSTLKVRLDSKGGGLTFGKSTIDNGTGEFSGVHDIRDVLGDYAQGGAHGGAGTSAGVMGLTKGEVSLSLKGEGRGVDAGIDFGKFTISEAEASAGASPSESTPAAASTPAPQ
jgi:hypothetical protein